MSDQATKILRVAEVREMILGGFSSGEICRSVSETYGVTERTVERDIAAARKVIRKAAERQTEEALYEHLEARRYIRQRAIKAGDLRAALDALKDEAKLLGLYENSKLTLEISPELVRLMDKLGVNLSEMVTELEKLLRENLPDEQ